MSKSLNANRVDLKALNSILAPLIRKLLQLPHITNVLPEEHCYKQINFKITHTATTWEQERLIFDQVYDLVIKAEWKLCDLTKSEDWHFRINNKYECIRSL